MKKKCYLISLEDPEGLTGSSLKKCLTAINEVYPFEFTIFDKISCFFFPTTSYSMSFLHDNSCRVFAKEQLFEFLEGIKHFEWGDFFLFHSYPYHWEKKEQISNYPTLIAQTDVTVRAVDDQYIYIYTSQENVIKKLENFGKLDFLKFDELEYLDFPY